jgi:uncharacterized protein (DUF952 family)
MGFKLQVNSILRTDQTYELAVGAIFPFEKTGSRIFFDNIPIWLTDKDWTALADISIVSQTREKGQLTGTFRVDYLYHGDEQKFISNMFIRMYGGLFDPYIYLLSSQLEYDEAMTSGSLVRASLDTDRFIHASPKSQLNRVANKFYQQAEQPLIMVVDKAKVTADIKWEPATGGLYPHIYGELNMNAVEKIVPIQLGEEGEFDIDLSLL